MGVCCSSHNKVEDTIQTHFQKMKILELSYEDVDSILKDQGPLNLELMKRRFSSKFNTLFEGTLDLISKENWIKISDNNFIDFSDKKEHIESQLILFKIMYDIKSEYFKTGSKTGLLMNLLPYFSSSNTDSSLTKSDKFFKLISAHDFKFDEFKSFYKIYVRNALVCPLQALRESLEKSDDDQKEKFLEEIDEYIKDNFTLELVGKFVNSIFREFEKLMLKNYHNYAGDFIFSKKDFDLVFRKKEELFDLYYLRRAYLSKLV